MINAGAVVTVIGTARVAAGLMAVGPSIGIEQHGNHRHPYDEANYQNQEDHHETHGISLSVADSGMKWEARN
jgi:hypothetical protein